MTTDITTDLTKTDHTPMQERQADLAADFDALLAGLPRCEEDHLFAPATSDDDEIVRLRVQRDELVARLEQDGEEVALSEQLQLSVINEKINTRLNETSKGGGIRIRVRGLDWDTRDQLYEEFNAKGDDGKEVFDLNGYTIAAIAEQITTPKLAREDVMKLRATLTMGEWNRLDQHCGALTVREAQVDLPN